MTELDEQMVQQHLHEVMAYGLAVNMDALELRLARTARKRGYELVTLWLLACVLVTGYLSFFTDASTLTVIVCCVFVMAVWTVEVRAKVEVVN